MGKLKVTLLFLVAVILFSANKGFSQSDNFITQYDPYIISLKKFTFYYPVDDEPLNSSSNMIIVIQGNIGTQKNAFIKFLTADQLSFESAREFEDGYIQEVGVLDKMGALIPPLKDLQGKNFLELNIYGYADLNRSDFEKIKGIAGAGLLAVASSLRAPFIGIYKNYPQPTEVLKPTDERWAEAEAFLAGMGTRNKVNLGSVVFTVPIVTDVRNISGGDNLVPGDKTVSEEKGRTIAIVNFRELKDELMVYDQDYYKELYQIFLKHGGTPSNQAGLTGDMIEMTDFKAEGFRDQDDIYINPEAKKQLGYILDVLIASVPIKNDTAETTSSTLPLELQVALDYFRANLTQERTRFNKYIFQTFLSDETNKAKLKREIDRVRAYYNYMN
jgi:hypothetical protein